MATLAATIETLEGKCIEVQANCDGFINIIEECNNSIISLGTQNAITSEAISGLKDFDSLSIEEKEQLIQSIIDAMTERYNYIKETYLEIPENFALFGSLVAILGIYYKTGTNSAALVDFSTGDFSPDVFLRLIDYCEENNIMPMLNSYFNGASWEESGLSKFLYNNVTGVEYSESYFLSELSSIMSYNDLFPEINWSDI